MRTLAGVAVLLGLYAVDVRPLGAADSLDRPVSPTTMVTGMAFVDLRDHTGADVQYRVRINAFEDPEDGFQGSVTSQITRGDYGTLHVFSRVTCVLVWHNSAWISSVVTHSTNDAVYAPGDLILTYVKDFGDVGDVVHQEAVRNLPTGTFDVDGDGDVDCHDRPALYPSTVRSGDIVIK